VELTGAPAIDSTASLEVAYDNFHGWLLHQAQNRMATYDGHEWQPKFSIEYYIDAKQQLRASLQWVGITAKQERVYLVPAEPGELVRIVDPAVRGDFSISDLSFQVRYRWEIAPLSDVFLVWTMQADQTRALGDSDAESLFEDAFDEPQFNSIVLKVRYRIGS
jgi:hypothetical protein